MILRDSRKDETYWHAYFEQASRLLERRSKEAINPSGSRNSRNSFYSTVFRGLKELALAQYSAGYDLEDVRETFKKSLEWFGYFYDFASQDKDDMLQEWYKGHNEVYTILSLCVLLDIEKERVAKFVQYMDTYRFRDEIWERMLSFIGFEGREPVTERLWPEAYGRLAKVFDGPGGALPDYLTDFVKRWYRSLSSQYWNGYHTSEWNLYFGYWCVEGAAAAKMLKIDDSALIKNVYYPYDLVRYSELARGDLY